MNIQIKATNTTLTPAITDYINKRLESIAKFADTDTAEALCRVEVGKTSQHHKHGDIFIAEINMTSQGQNYFARVELSDLYSAIDKVRDEVLEKMKSVKGKRLTTLRKGGAKVKSVIRQWFGKEE